MSNLPNGSDKRDNFPAPVVRALGGRAGYICSHPSCGRLTIGPSEDRVSRLSNVGVAAHITAASSEGPRYDPSLTPEERSSEANGIWMCQIHAKLIDDNANIYSPEDLKRWKHQHETWVSQRLANSENYTADGVSYLLTENVGPLVIDERIRFGRLTLVLGENGAGKTTLCEAVTAFAGDPHFSTFADRWNFTRGKAVAAKAIEAGLARGGAQTRVRISDPGASDAARIRIEIDGNVAPAWPRSDLRAVHLGHRVFNCASECDPLVKGLQVLAPQLGLPVEVLIAGLRDDVFASSSFRCTFRENRGKLEIKTPSSSGGFLPAWNLSHSELRWLLVELLLRVMETDCRSAPWLLCLDTGFFSSLDHDNKISLIRRLTSASHINLQIIACVVFDDDLEMIRTNNIERWLLAKRHGKLTIHSFS